MWKYLDKIREKNDSEKKSFAFITAMTLTILIAVVWLISTYAISSSVEENKAETISPIENIRSQFRVLTD